MPHWLDGPLAIAVPAFRRLQQAVLAAHARPQLPAAVTGDAEERLLARTVAAAPGRGSSAQGAVAVLTVRGTLVPHTTAWSFWFDEIGVDRVQQALRAALADVGVGAIVLDLDSPGGSVYAIEELAAEIRAARAQKPIVAIANPLAASAAYYLLSAATEAYVTPSGEVGSVGVYSLHLDWSRSLDAEGITPTFIFAGAHKVEGNPYEPLTDDARQALQASVDRYYDLFVKAVAKGRGVSVTAVRESFGQGRVVGAREALAAKMVDAVGTLDEAIARAAALTRVTRTDGAAADATSAHGIVAEAAAFERVVQRCVEILAPGLVLAADAGRAAEALAPLLADDASLIRQLQEVLAGGTKVLTLDADALRAAETLAPLVVPEATAAPVEAQDDESDALALAALAAGVEALR